MATFLHNHYGYRKIFPFERFGDTNTFWIQKRYQISQQDYEEKPIATTALAIDDVAMTENREFADKEPWLLKSDVRTSVPGRLVVTETYGYLPPIHEYPGKVTFEYPGYEETDGLVSSTIDAVQLLPNGRVKVILTASLGSALQAGDTVILSRPYFRVGLQYFWKLTSAPARIAVATSSTVELENVVMKNQYGSTVANSELPRAFAETGMKGTLRQSMRIRIARTEATTAIYRREYVRFLPASYSRTGQEKTGASQPTDFAQLPPIVPRFQPIAADGSATDTLTTTTTPSLAEWRTYLTDRVPLAAESSNFGQEMGDIWFLETPYVWPTE